MCNDEALNAVIFTINANTHVFVHVALHEIYLLNINHCDIKNLMFKKVRNCKRLKLLTIDHFASR